ncbi:MAG: hypothetical protein ACTHMR_08090, partial [Thermomicrobiales bacterium]
SRAVGRSGSGCSSAQWLVARAARLRRASTGAHDALSLAKLLILNCFVVLGTAYQTYEHILRPTGLAAKLNASGPQVGAPPAPENHVSA